MATLPASGVISISDINAEFALGNNLNAYRSTTWYTDAGGSGTFSAGAISMSDFYSKRKTSPVFNISFSGGTTYTDVNLRTWAISMGWNQVSLLNVTLPGTSIIRSSSTSIPALTINGSFPNGVTFTNTGGWVVGKGGMGGKIGYNAATAGGTALSVSSACTIYNTGTIGGGGGGGGANGDFGSPFGWIGGGGGAGYGEMGWSTYWNPPGYGGYWVYPAGGGTQYGTHNARSPVSSWTTNFPYVGPTYAAKPLAGSGGSLGAAGTASQNAYLLASDKYGSSYTPIGGSLAGAAGGAAVAGNANITWGATGTRLGAIT